MFSQISRHICWSILQPVCVIASASMAAWSAETEQTTRDLPDVIGVTHVNGKYHLTDQDFLNEGADQVFRLGSRVIKLYLTVEFNRNVPRPTAPVDTNDAVRGFWLLRPDGSKSPAWHLLHAKLRGS